eukprot:6183013-Amphidinium_carterae.1
MAHRTVLNRISCVVAAVAQFYFMVQVQPGVVPCVFVVVVAVVTVVSGVVAAGGGGGGGGVVAA